MKKMKRYNGEEGSEVKVDPLEAANASEASKNIADEAEGERILERMRDEAAKPKPKPKAMAKPAPKAAAAPAPAPKASPVDETKLSLSDRFKLSRDRSRSGSGPTDTRSVSQRLRSAFGMKNGGSASSRADGIASKGKTRGKMC
jgi:hypothetical protein